VILGDVVEIVGDRAAHVFDRVVLELLEEGEDRGWIVLKRL
jgi:hypothetical protein